MATSSDTPIDLNANHDPELYGTTITFIILSIVAVILRVVANRLRKNKFRLDDYLIFAALILQLGLCSHICVGISQYGVGRHSAALTQAQVTNYFKMVYVSTLLQPCVLALCKLAILYLYRSVFTTCSFKLMTDITIGVVFVWWVCVFFADALICLPPEKNWNPKMPGYCGDAHLLNILSPVPWIATDLSILLMPIPPLLKLQRPKKEKIALVGMFMLGGFATVSSAVRYSTVFYADEDFTWSQTGITTWSVIESSTAVISACLIVIKPVIVKLWPSRLLDSIHIPSFPSPSAFFSSGRSPSTDSGGHKKELLPTSLRNAVPRLTRDPTTRTEVRANPAGRWECSLGSEKDPHQGIKGIQVRSDVEVATSRCERSSRYPDV